MKLLRRTGMLIDENKTILVINDNEVDKCGDHTRAQADTVVSTCTSAFGSVKAPR